MSIGERINLTPETWPIVEMSDPTEQQALLVTGKVKRRRKF